mmetsp:Transcript_151749/g.486868  ORF Transcript_151749/g.486868 Transcript_151749/m.486868 type:complete len:607 (-) Transcript_151749:215-2035(-)
MSAMAQPLNSQRSRSMPEYIRMEQAPSKPRAPPKPCIIRTYETTPFLMRVIFKCLEDQEKSHEVPVVLFRRVLRRFIDTFDPRMQFDLDAWGSRQNKFKMTWADVRLSIEEGLLPMVPLSCPQRIFLTMEDFTSSNTAMLYYIVLNIAIVANIGSIVLASLETKGDFFADNFQIVSELCVYLFVFDYSMKALCVTSCPIALFDEAWLIETATMPGVMKFSQSLQPTKWQRFIHWATSPTNLIDFFSILPWLLTLVAGQVHLPLSALRMLRLLRVIRVLRAFKAVGKWVITLQVLGEAFYSSLGSILVLVVYIGLFSMVAGAILYQQEHKDNPHDWHDVPSSMRGVVEMFVGKSFSVSNSVVSALVLASVGMFKGIIFLLPITKLRNATQTSQNHVDMLANLRDQVETEALPQQIEWASDFNCPCVRVRVHEEGQEKGSIPAIGMLNVPLHELEPVDVLMQVPLHGGPQRMCAARPEVDIKMLWTPSGKNPRLPHGKLSVKILQGRNFSGYASSRWRVELEVPEKLYGKGAQTEWMYPLSQTGAPEPAWGDEAAHTFNIDWEVAEDPNHEMPEQAFQRQVLELLHAQAKKIDSLESEVSALRAEQKK